MITLAYTSPLGSTVTFTGAYKYRSTDGLFGFSNHVIIDQSPGSSIGTLRDVYQKPKHFTITLILNGISGAEVSTARSNLGAILSEKNGTQEGYVTVTTENATRRLYCTVVDYYPSHELGEGKRHQFVTIEFTAASAYFVDTDGELSTGLLDVMPYAWLLPGKLPMGTVQYGGLYSISNPGDVACPMKIYIHGQTKPPKVVTDTTLECVEWIQTTEELRVNTDPKDIEVVVRKLGVTDVNGFYKTAPNTQYPLLPPGVSNVEIWIDGIDSNTTLEIRFTPYYANI
jgi:hypothetical protein